MSKNNKNKIWNWDWVYRYYLYLWTLIPLAGFTFSGIVAGSEFASNSTPLLVYFYLVVFTLPSLISINLLGGKTFGIKSAYSFLIYPVVYIIGLMLRSRGVGLSEFYPIAGILIIFLWNIFLWRMIAKAKYRKLMLSLKEIFFGILPFLIFMAITILVRDFGSIISTDTLVHKTVLNGMEDPVRLGFMPSNYSSTFTDQAYPIVMFHTFLYMLTNAFNFSYSLIGYFLDIFLTFIFSIATFSLFRKYFTVGWSSLGVILSLLVFENLAYTAQFLIPQTFCFLLFVYILNSSRLNIKSLLASIVLLTLTHFFIGLFLSGILVLRYIYLGNILKLGQKQERNILTREIFLVIILIIVASALGFSVERFFQQDIVKWVGDLTNPEFKGKIDAVFNLFGYIWIIFLPILIITIFKKKRSLPEGIGYIGIAANIGFFFLGPVFAGKFLLGFGLFSSLIMISYLSNLRPQKKLLNLIMALLLIIIYGVNFAIQLRDLSSFLDQNEGKTTAIVVKDNDLINYWIEKKPTCILISDPHTQLTIHSLGKGETLRGNYMILDDRRKLVDFVNQPNDKTFGKVLNMKDLQDEEYKDKDICIDISSRLLELVESENPWKDYIFLYKVDHAKELDLNTKIIKYLDKNSSKIYGDKYHSVYLID